MKRDSILAYSVLLQSVLAIVQLILPMYGLYTVERAADVRVYATLLLVAPCIYIVFRRNLKSLLIPFAIYFSLLLLHYIIFPASHTFIESRKALTLTPICILSGIFVYNIRNLEKFKRAFLVISHISFPLAVLFIWGSLYSPFLLDESKYDMSFGYTILLPTLYLFIQDNGWDKAISIIMWLLIVYGASRGPAVVAVFFYLISILFYSNFKKKKKFKFWNFAIFFAIILSVFAFLPKLIDFQSSRTVMLFEEGEGFTHDSNRNVIWDQVITRISESPILGNGIGSDWYFIGGYCHNFFLEITLHYGFLVAGIFCLYILYLSFSIFKDKRKLACNLDKQLYLLVLLCGFMPLMVSSSYLLNANFGLAIGYLYRYKSYKIF